MKYKGIKIHKNKKCTTWYTRIRENGKQKYISAKTQKECYNKLKIEINKTKRHNEGNITTQTQEEVSHGGSSHSQLQKQTTARPSLKKWFLQWLELYKIEKVKQTTIKDYYTIMNKISSKLKETSINKITLIDILNELNNIKQERQKQKVYELLKMLYKKAYDNELIEKNLMSRIDKPKHKKINSQPLTKKEEELLIKICNNIKYGDLYKITLYQGLRKGEILALTDKDIDLEHNIITINKSINYYNKIDTTKNEQSTRIIPIFNRTKTILKKYENKKGRLFDISYKRIDDTTKKIKEILNKTNFKIKDLRSTFITRCQEQNIPEFIIQSWVGHKIGSKITSQVYTKYNYEDNTKYIDIINKIFNSNSTHEKK